ncbi:MAG: hypothetical protein HY700_00805 [Gemmatimonadetes bacterium]|nr:hypothetical protein [Gemmatimonadota bacterium]
MSIYTDTEWEAENAALWAGANPQSCPQCTRTGFYGPRKNRAERKYRACRFCGFWQVVGRNPEQYRASVPRCHGWPQAAGAPYLWWAAPGEESYACEHCGHLVDVQATLIDAPAQDRSHPWWNVPQNLTQAEYTRYWVRNGAGPRLFGIL